MNEKSFFWIYILSLENGSYYTGYCKDLVRRYTQHLKGKGAKITRSFRPVNIVACWKLYAGRGAALQLEAWIKSRTREEKQRLIDNPETLGRLYARPEEERLRLLSWDSRGVLQEVQRARQAEPNENRKLR